MSEQSLLGKQLRKRKQCAGVTVGKLTVPYKRKHAVRQLEQSEHVRYLCAGLSDLFRRVLLRETAAFDKIAVSARLFDGVQILALKVLDQRKHCRLFVVSIFDYYRYLGQTRHSGGSPAAFSGYNTVKTVSVFTDDYRLNNSVFTYGFRKLGERLRVEFSARLRRIRFYIGYAELRYPASRGRAVIVVGKQGVKPAAESSFYCHYLHLSINSSVTAEYAAAPLELRS